MVIGTLNEHANKDNVYISRNCAKKQRTVMRYSKFLIGKPRAQIRFTLVPSNYHKRMGKIKELEPARDKKITLLISFDDRQARVYIYTQAGTRR